MVGGRRKKRKCDADALGTAEADDGKDGRRPDL